MTIQAITAAQRRFFNTGATLPIENRLAVLRKLKTTIQRREAEIAAALKEDLGKSEQESYMCEIGLTLAELDYQIRHVKGWTRRAFKWTELANFPSIGFTVQEPYGLVLVMSPWNYPFMLCMEPMIGAVAAGNCCVLKPSDYSPATSRIIREIVAEVFPPAYVTTVLGGRKENAALLEERFDYIFFTGGDVVGRLVMEKAAKHLTPVSLELGGKSPCVVTRDADLRLAAKRIAFGKYLNCGQTCVAPDYLLIDRRVKTEFLALFKEAVAAMYGRDPLKNRDYGRIINARHYERIMGLMDPEKVILGGVGDSETCRIAPTVMDNVTADDAVMQEEIFGPILPVIAYDTLEEAEAFIRSREKPLALYLFTRTQGVEERFLRHVPFGGGCVNDVVVHLATSHMGFGGVGRSGMGAYHGKKSFETFSHEKSILKKFPWPDLPLRYQPYTKGKLKVIKKVLK